MNVDDVAHVLAVRHYHYTNEDELQAIVTDVLQSKGWEPVREVRLSATATIDVMVGRVGVECKVAGGVAAVIRQLNRYAASTAVDGLVLVTNRANHAKVPRVLRGKPVRVVLAVAGL